MIHKVLSSYNTSSEVQFCSQIMNFLLRISFADRTYVAAISEGQESLKHHKEAPKNQVCAAICNS